MSASQEKKKRTADNTDGLSKREAAELSENQKRKKTRLWTIVITVVCVLVAAFALVYTSSLPYRLPAVEVNGETYSARELNYYYHSAYFSFYESNSSWISYLIDPQTPLSEQKYTDDMTWEDYFLDTAVSNMGYVAAMCDAAEAAGFELPEEYKQDIETAKLSNQYYASSYGTTVDGFLAANYGKGCTEKFFNSVIERDVLATAYSQSIYDSYEYGDDELSSYYDENKDDFDKISYLAYEVEAADYEPEEEPTETEEPVETEKPAETEEAPASEEARAEAKAAAEALLEAETEEEFILLVSKNFDGATVTPGRYAGSALSAEYKDYLLDEARAEGDSTVIESGDSFYAVMFLGRDDNHYNTVSARHILVKCVDTDEDGTISDEEKKTALDSIESVKAEFESDPTEEHFIELVTAHSEDTAVDGLYEEIYKGQMVEEFDAFCFGERQPGDYEIVYGESSSYSGYHLVYFVGAEGRLYSNILADNSLRSTAYSEWQTAAVEGYTEHTEKLAFKLAGD